MGWNSPNEVCTIVAVVSSYSVYTLVLKHGKLYCSIHMGKAWQTTLKLQRSSISYIECGTGLHSAELRKKTCFRALFEVTAVACNLKQKISHSDEYHGSVLILILTAESGSQHELYPCSIQCASDTLLKSSPDCC